MNLKKKSNKINLNKINVKLSGEFPNTKIIQSNIKSDYFEIYYNNSKTNKKNNFKILDGGTKDRILRRVKILLKNQGFIIMIYKNIIKIII
jgi:hypothetical protein